MKTVVTGDVGLKNYTRRFINHIISVLGWRLVKKDSFMLSSVFKKAGTENAWYFVDDMINTIEDDKEDYATNDLRPTDIVLDIGACIGGFAIENAKKVKWVYAVEPLYTDRLNDNILLNKINNITVLDVGLGNGIETMRFGKLTKEVRCFPLKEIVKMCGGHVDLVKIDVEGEEWHLNSSDFDGIRRVEMELHDYIARENKIHDLKDFERYLSMLEQAGFRLKARRIGGLLLISGWKQ